jgi:hypothetical protein
MDDELERWSQTWKAMEIKETNMLQHAQTAHRQEAMTRLAMFTALAAGLVALVMRVNQQLSSGTLNERWTENAIVVGALLLGALVMRRWGQQIAASRAELVQTPHGMLSDLIRLRERELELWVGRRAVIMTSVLAVAALALVSQQLVRAQAAGEPMGRAWLALGFLVIYSIGLVAFGMGRVRYLRRELDSLHEMRTELDLNAREESRPGAGAN